MNRPNKETLRRVIRKMHKQNDHEKLAEKLSASTNMPVKIRPCITHQTKCQRSQ
ncbi:MULTISPECIES: hypothetical protein [Bacteroides]|uniref:hypothetical protein n=1 Tax=Bacteroides TaxID=816 RepID=UPI001CB7DFF9|nr:MULTISPECIES: hypothetical protein [Bacteroides]